MGTTSSNSNNTQKPRKSSQKSLPNRSSNSGEDVGRTVVGAESARSDPKARGDLLSEEKMAVVDAIILTEDEAAREELRDEMRRKWTRDELYSPQWLFAIVKRHNLVDDESLKVLMEYEYDIHLIKKFGDAKLKELGVSEQSRKNLIHLASQM